MFRLANFGDENIKEDGLYRYLSNAVSLTIIDCLDEYIDNLERYILFYEMFFEGGFFAGISEYISPKVSCTNFSEADDLVGFEFTLSKMKRMKEKMQDKEEVYTFDLFEERVLFCMCSLMKKRARTAEGRKRNEQLKEKIETAKTELRKKYGLTLKMANDYSRKMYNPAAMLLKDDEDDNLIFWDDDYEFFWKDGFVSGIKYLKDLAGQTAGYGFKYTCDLFSDIGIKPPLMLLGTEEANRIATEVQTEQYRRAMDELFGSILDAKSLDDVHRRFEKNDDT